MNTQTAKTDCTCAERRADWDLHPNANRALENNDAKDDLQHSHHHDHSQQGQVQQQKTDSPCQCGKNEWDLHPAAIRKIENEGSPADVKQLHELEHSQQKH
ncbi:hypothetical protein BC939DRAFT_500462 [Gamsiella multidivaricata]|uniref:uncharacterized protein n=1 Tax=Gamsiella multidivaricata TaxID=101098 RepID=UPI00221E49AC|nr:uncharacterized protein BC939DRAFT_500462 [Gamsiella multidivaricata]KAG0368298.1 hypothetical protein BGZ54_002258 [Gamsiella multidivaricata]KAI7829016.1 hypothetical protein BC939DRAFT_500462 [Gamsiella multidivaricata]